MRSTAAKKRSPLRLTSPLRSTKLHVAHSHSGHIDAKVSHTLTTRHGGGRNSPRVSKTIPLHNCPVNDLTAPSVRSLAIVHASLTILRVTLHRILKIVPLHSFRGNPLQMTKLPRPYLKSGWLRVVALVRLSQWRLPGLPVHSVQGQRERFSALRALLLSVAD